MNRQVGIEHVNNNVYKILMFSNAFHDSFQIIFQSYSFLI